MIHKPNKDRTTNPPTGNSSDKRASDMIIKLQEEKAYLRLVLGKLTRLCEDSHLQDESEDWYLMIGAAKEAMYNTDPNKKQSRIWKK